MEKTFLLYSNTTELARLKAAAKTTKQTVSAFILLAAIDRANEVLHAKEQKELMNSLSMRSGGVQQSKREITKW